MISSGDQDGPQPPEEQVDAVEGESNISTITAVSLMCPSYSIVTAPNGQARTQTPQPVQRLSSMV